MSPYINQNNNHGYQRYLWTIKRFTIGCQVSCPVARNPRWCWGPQLGPSRTSGAPRALARPRRAQPSLHIGRGLPKPFVDVVDHVSDSPLHGFQDLRSVGVKLPAGCLQSHRLAWCLLFVVAWPQPWRRRTDFHGLSRLFSQLSCSVVVV